MYIKDKTIDELKSLSQLIRDKIIDTVSKNGGHLSSPLGAVELTIAMHYVFDVEKDPFIFDVSHQAYPHKLLTRRWDSFDSLRQFGGISGFTKPKESDYDYFVAGHSSTSISLAVGSAKSIQLKGENRIPIVMIGDGSMTAGIAYEALNELGFLKLPVIIILNDNEMSIAKPIGAVSKHLSKLLAGNLYQGFKEKVDYIVKNYMPEGSSYIAKKIEESMKLITPGIIFEEMGIDYIGPIDGHNLEEIINTFKLAKQLKKPVIVHAKTIKGKGYTIAEGQIEKWHGVGAFDKKTGEFLKKSSTKSATQIFSDKLLQMCYKHKNIVGVTAAMPSGTGIDKLIKEFPNRFWDVAIAEQHAITSMAAMAKEGFKPFIAIYSTFLQRGFDQIIHDVAIMSLPVVFAIDRAGIVGNDGETHQGQFDISFLRTIPNLSLLAPIDAKSLELAIEFAYHYDKPLAIRYPRGGFVELPYEVVEYQEGKSNLLEDSDGDMLFIGYGMGVATAYQTKQILKDSEIALLDLRFVKPLDTKMLLRLSQRFSKWYIFSDSSKQGGVSSAINEFLVENKIYHIKLTTFEYEDIFITHGDTQKVKESLGLLPHQIANKYF